MPESNGASSRAVKVAVYATLMYDIISATNSSPQTTEINASVRAGTLMKWVKLGLLQGLAFVGIGVMLDEERWPPLLGGGLAAILLWIQYKHAERAGLENPGPGTEEFGGAGGGSFPVQGGGQEQTEPESEPEISPFTELPAMS